MRKKENNFVYSLRINKEQNSLLKNNKNIKEDLNKYVREYINSFLHEKSSKQ